MEICGEGFFWRPKNETDKRFFQCSFIRNGFFCTTLLLLCFLIVGIHSSGISIPLSLFIYMNCLFDFARVVIRVTINKIYFVPEWLVSCVVGMLWNGGGLGTGESDVLIVLFNCISHRSSSFSDVQLAALTFTFIERQQTHICSCSRGYGIKEQKKSQKNVVYFLSAKGKSWNKNSQKRKSLKNYSFKYELEITFLLIFYAWQRRLKR